MFIQKQFCWNPQNEHLHLWIQTKSNKLHSYCSVFHLHFKYMLITVCVFNEQISSFLSFMTIFHCIYLGYGLIWFSAFISCCFWLIYFIPLGSITFVFSSSPMVKGRKKVTVKGCNTPDFVHWGWGQWTGHVNQLWAKGQHSRSTTLIQNWAQTGGFMLDQGGVAAMVHLLDEWVAGITDQWMSDNRDIILMLQVLIQASKTEQKNPTKTYVENYSLHF